MITTENPTGAISLADMEKLTGTFAANYNAVRSIVADMTHEMDRVKAKYITGLRNAVARAQTSRAALQTAIEGAPELFAKPRTQIMHGIKIGFTKGKGKLEIADEESTVQKIHKLMEQPENYIRVFEVPNKDALAELPAADLKKLGVTVIDAGDAVVIKPVDGEVDKIVAALLKPEKEVA